MDLGLKIIPIIVGTPPIDPKKDPKGASVETNKKRKPWSKGWLGFSINHILYIDARNENALASSKKTVEETIAKEMLALFSIQAPQLSSSGQFSNIRDALLAGEETAVMSLIETTTEDLNMPCETGQTILELAVAKCSPETLEILFKHGLRANLFNTAPLVIAVQRNARDLIELLIRYGADLNASNMMKATALHIAATVGTRELCELLLQNKANTEMYNSSGYTPFLAAVSAQKLENIVAFVENGSNIFALDQLDGNSSLHILCMNSQNAKTLEIFQILVQAGAQIEATNHDGFTPLAIAVSKGATQLVYEFMKDENADQIFRATVDGKSLLHLASQKGRMDLVKLFTSSKSPITYDLKAEDYNEMTPIGLAITNGWLDIVKYFVSLDTSLLTIKNDMHGSLQLIAAKNEQSDILRYLIVESGHSYDVKETDAETGMTSLIYKIKSGCHASIKILKTLEPGLLKMKSHDGTTTIAFAAGHGQLELLRQMLEDDEIRKNIKDIDSKGWTALTHAIENGSLEIVKVLCEADSSLLNKKDKKGRNMLSMAAMRNKFEIFDFILSHPDFEADLADVDSEGYSALHFAAQSGSLAIVEMLCDKYPTLMTLKTCHGANAVSLAAKYGCLDVLKVLVLNHQEIMFDLKVSDHTEGLTAFMNAVIHDHTERRNPLFRAAWSASFHSLKYLLEQNYFKFDISSTDYHNNWNVMSYAVEGGSVDILHYLHKQNPSLINVKSVTLASLLHIATDTGDILYEEGNTKKANDTKLCECLKFLVPNGKFHLNEADAEGYSALARAIEGGLVKCSKYLLSLNPSQISFRMYDQQSLIHLAVGKGDNVDCLKFLLSDTYRSKFNLKATDRTGSAPLTLAVLKGNIKCVEYLLEVEPALISNRTEEGLSVLEIAAAAAQKRTFKFLFRYFEADLQSESFALSVLAFAAFGGHEGITKYARSKLDKIFVGMTHPATFDSITLSTLSCVTQYALTKSLGNVTKVLSMGFIIGSICNNHEPSIMPKQEKWCRGSCNSIVAISSLFHL
ncbi:ankyrin repeat-containing domain protein [Chytriomyces sp. MP71]|nr:ankyrin repeat-containing domain protein [Chytriomyces sp. MP71]